VSRPTQVPCLALPVRGYHPLWPNFPVGSSCPHKGAGLVRVRSPLLTESRLMSFPPATKMFQFAGFASKSLCIQDKDTFIDNQKSEPGKPVGPPCSSSEAFRPRSSSYRRWVSPFGDLRVNGCSHLTIAYRSVPRPSSPLTAKASTKCP
jgi:hypothetical protein